MKISKTLVAAALSVVSVGALADVTVLGTSFVDGASTQATAIGTFTAYSGSSLGKFDFKAQQGGYQGVGIEGSTAGEIDRTEKITGVLNNAYGISQFTLGLLFDGPEYGDVNEKAQVTVDFADDNSTTLFSYTLTSVNATTALWTGFAGATVQNLSPATLGLGGAWSVLNPFGNRKINSISFTALNGVCGTAGGKCDNQSDYTLVSVTAVPEVESYAMMLAGLGLMGTIARRRNKAKTV